MIKNKLRKSFGFPEKKTNQKHNENYKERSSGNGIKSLSSLSSSSTVSLPLNASLGSGYYNNKYNNNGLFLGIRASNTKSVSNSILKSPVRVIQADYGYIPTTPNELAFNAGEYLHVLKDDYDDSEFSYESLSGNEKSGLENANASTNHNNNRNSSLNTNGNTNTPAFFEAYDPRSGKHGFVPSAYFHTVSRISTTSTNSGITFGSDSVSSSKKCHIYGKVLYDFYSEREDEIDAKKNDAVLILAKANHEWVVVKPVGRLGGPGLLPITYIELRYLSSDHQLDHDDSIRAINLLPTVEEWKAQEAKYRASGIPVIS